MSLAAADLRSVETHGPLAAWRAADPRAQSRVLLNESEDIPEVIALSLAEELHAAAPVEFMAVQQVGVAA